MSHDATEFRVLDFVKVERNIVKVVVLYNVVSLRADSKALSPASTVIGQ